MFERKISKSLLYEDVISYLIEMIERGMVKPGEQFPTERELVEKMEVSRSVLREAFHILEEKGIISSIQGKGRFLRKIPAKELEPVSVLDLQKYTLIELYQVRDILEVGAMEALIASASSEEIGELHELLGELSARFRKNKNGQGEFEMHMAYAKCSHNEYLQAMLKHTVNKVYKIIWEGFPVVASQADYEGYIEDHSKILQAIDRRDAREATSLLRIHLGKTSSHINASGK